MLEFTESKSLFYNYSRETDKFVVNNASKKV